MTIITKIEYTAYNRRNSMQTKWNLCDLYSSNEDLLSDLEETKTLLETLCKFKGKLKKADKKTLKRYFQTDEKFSLILEKMEIGRASWRERVLAGV